jgi:drug/metabolite transporter (DMT)-like permease
MAFYQNAVFLVGSAVGAVVLFLWGIQDAVHPSLKFLVRPWAMPTLVDTLLIASCGIVAAVGTLLLTNAYRVARTSAVTPFEYTGMLWAPLWGFLFFAETPKLSTLTGAAIIGAAGLLAMRQARST